VIGPKRAAQSVLAALNAEKISEALDQFKGQFEYIDYAPGLEFVDKLRLTEFFQKSRELFPDTVVQVNVTFECEDHALVEWTLTSTQTIDLYRTRCQFSLRGVSIAHVENGKISHWHDYYDQLASRRNNLGALFTEWTEY
jgi:ketosteroid isomerase-like protein